jgi:bla regulator protein blaR1
MTTYLMYCLQSGLSLLLLLGLYTLLLERQPMHRLKRAYLLGTLLVAGAAPLLTIEVQPQPLPLPNESPARFIPIRQPVELAIDMLTARNLPDDAGLFGLWCYAVVTAALLLRFGRNLYRLAAQVRTHPTQRWRGLTLVLLPGEVLPHTFLRYLFVSKTAWEQGRIEPELLTHEAAHSRQYHSLDVLLLELTRCFGWWNPGLYWLRRAVQRNHEYLADEAVTATFGNVPNYQHLLLNKLALATPAGTLAPALASTLTFQTTKQRLLMMTKTTTPARTALAALSATLLLGLTAALLITTTAPAQVQPAQPAKAVAAAATPQMEVTQLSVEEMERRFGNKKVRYHIRGVGTRAKLFSSLTPDQKRRVVYFPPHGPKTPSEAEFEAFKNPKKYGVWVDEKRTRNFPKTTLKASDIVYYDMSYVHKNARQPEGYLYQLGLYTKAGYEKYLTYFEENPMLILDPTVKPASR